MLETEHNQIRGSRLQMYLENLNKRRWRQTDSAVQLLKVHYPPYSCLNKNLSAWNQYLFFFACLLYMRPAPLTDTVPLSSSGLLLSIGAAELSSQCRPYSITLNFWMLMTKRLEKTFFLKQDLDTSLSTYTTQLSLFFFNAKHLDRHLGTSS